MHQNPMEQIEKIVVNAGIGRLSAAPNFDKLLPDLINEMGLIVGQKPAPRPARQSISGFKLRAGTIVGLKATLRRKRMADFLRKLIQVVLPRIRDFRGIDPKNVDAQGNLNIGIKEHVTFPEVSAEHAKANFGLEVTVVPKYIKNRDAALQLYKELGIPFKKSKS